MVFGLRRSSRRGPSRFQRLSDSMTDEELELLEAAHRPLTVREYAALADEGAFDHEPVELLRGRLVKNPP